MTYKIVILPEVLAFKTRCSGHFFFGFKACVFPVVVKTSTFPWGNPSSLIISLKWSSFLLLYSQGQGIMHKSGILGFFIPLALMIRSEMDI